MVDHLTADYFATTSSASGAAEQRTVACLEERLGGRHAILSDRKIPGARGVIDHVVVAASGVWVVDSRWANSGFELRRASYRAPWLNDSVADRESASSYDGPPALSGESDDDRAFLSLLDQLGELDRSTATDDTRLDGDDCLLVDGHDRTWVVGRISSKADAVQEVLRFRIGPDRAIVNPAVSFVGDWEPPAESRAVAGVWVAWPEALARLIEAPGHLGDGDVEEVAAALDKAFPPAVADTSRPAAPLV